MKSKTKSKTKTKTEVVIIENDERDLRYLVSFIKTLRVRVNGGARMAAIPKPLASENEARKKMPADNWALARNAGCIILDIDLGEGAKEAGINWMGDISENAETPIIVVTANRPRFQPALQTVDGLAPFLVIEKPTGGLPDTLNSSHDEGLARFNDILSQGIISACYISGRLDILRKTSQSKPQKNEDKHEILFSMLREYPVRTLLALFLSAVISVACLLIALHHWHIIGI